MYQNQRLELRLSTRDLIILDRKRGNVSRSKYLRWLIHYGPGVEDPVQPPVPEPIGPPIPPDPPVETDGF